MKTNSTSRSAFFNPRVFCSIGLLLALAGLSKSVTGMSAGATQSNPVPLINQPLVPDAAAPGGPGFTLTVNGTGFVSGSVVNWNGSPRSTTFVGGSQLTAAILASDIASASTASVTVVSPSLGGGTSNVVFCSITLTTSAVPLSRADVVTGSGPSGVITDDFNGDGNLDLCTADEGVSTIGISLGNGDGTFQPHVEYATTHPDEPIARDFNGDGKLDLAVTNGFYANTVSILLGNGDGTFQAAVDYATGSVPIWSTTGDFNADGKLDLAVANLGNFDGRTVSILLGNGDGTFQRHVDYATGEIPGSVTTGDFNGDGKLDLALSNQAGSTVSILLGNGDGTFQPHTDYVTGVMVQTVITGDFNADGKLDLAVTSADSSNTVSILLGIGNGTFPTHAEYTTRGPTRHVTIGDFNGDNKLDLAVPINESNALSLLLGVGDGTFPTHVEYGVGSVASGVTTGDFNGDGRLDLAVANYGDSTVSVMLQGTTVALSETSLKFGVELVGSRSAPQTATLTNSGPTTLTISSIAADGDFLQKNNCGSSLAPGASCTIKVAFKPSAKGVRTGTVTITDDAADSPQTIALTGTGTVVQVSPTALDFGDQIVGTTSDPQTTTVTNFGSEDLHIFGIGIGGPNFGNFAETTTCRSRLAPGESCTIGVTFTPGARGHRHASLKVADNGGASPQRVPLAGTGVRR